MGIFTDRFGHASINERPADKVSQPNTNSQAPVCKFCGGELIVVRANFDITTRRSDKSINCRECGRNQAGK